MKNLTDLSSSGFTIPITFKTAVDTYLKNSNLPPLLFKSIITLGPPMLTVPNMTTTITEMNMAMTCHESVHTTALRPP